MGERLDPKAPAAEPATSEAERETAAEASEPVVDAPSIDPSRMPPGLVRADAVPTGEIPPEARPYVQLGILDG